MIYGSYLGFKLLKQGIPWCQEQVENEFLICGTYVKNEISTSLSIDLTNQSCSTAYIFLVDFVANPTAFALLVDV